MITTATEYQSSLRIERSIEIDAPLNLAYEALLEILGPASTLPDGSPLPMVLEARPGGRWFRDLGEDTGHFWATVQVIKPPKLIEFVGPLFMSYPAISHLQYRLDEQGSDKTTLHLLHRAVGELDPEHCKQLAPGWDAKLKNIKSHSENRS